MKARAITNNLKIEWELFGVPMKFIRVADSLGWVAYVYEASDELNEKDLILDKDNPMDQAFNDTLNNIKQNMSADEVDKWYKDFSIVITKVILTRTNYPIYIKDDIFDAFTSGHKLDVYYLPKGSSKSKKKTIDAANFKPERSDVNADNYAALAAGVACKKFIDSLSPTELTRLSGKNNNDDDGVKKEAIYTELKNVIPIDRPYPLLDNSIASELYRMFFAFKFCQPDNWGQAYKVKLVGNENKLLCIQEARDTWEPEIPAWYWKFEFKIGIKIVGKESKKVEIKNPKFYVELKKMEDKTMEDWFAGKIGNKTKKKTYSNWLTYKKKNNLESEWEKKIVDDLKIPKKIKAKVKDYSQFISSDSGISDYLNLNSIEYHFQYGTSRKYRDRLSKLYSDEVIKPFLENHHALGMEAAWQTDSGYKFPTLEDRALNALKEFE